MQRLSVVLVLLALLVAIPIGLAPSASASTSGSVDDSSYIVVTDSGSTADSDIISANPCPKGWRGVIIGIGDDTQVLWLCTNIIP